MIEGVSRDANDMEQVAQPQAFPRFISEPGTHVDKDRRALSHECRTGRFTQAFRDFDRISINLPSIVGVGLKVSDPDLV
jgi:hypothetical protein